MRGTRLCPFPSEDEDAGRAELIVDGNDQGWRTQGKIPTLRVDDVGNN